MKQDNTWFSGPPPSLGWWPASISKYPGVYRWWNGKFWSDFVGKSSKAQNVGAFAKQKANCKQDSIEWQHRPANWPERSRT